MSMAWNLTDQAFGKDQPFLDAEPSSFMLNRPKIQNGTEFKEKSFILEILSKLKQFRNESRFCDVEVKVGERIFQAHGAVLAAWSPYFSAILNSQRKEVLNCILVEHLDADIFMEFLDFLYSGHIKPNERNVMDVLQLSKQLQIGSLTAFCEEFLNLTLDVSNFVNRLFTSHKYDLHGLASTVIAFGQQNLAIVVQQKEFLSMPPAKFFQLLNILKLGQNDMEVKLGLISHWVGFKIEEREKLVLHLLSAVNWTIAPSDVIRFITSSDNLFTANEFCLFQLMHRLFMTFQQLGPCMNTYQDLHQIFKDIIDLDFPRELSSSEDLEETIPISIVAVKEHCSNGNSLNLDLSNSEKKDASINTEIDSTYFHEIALLDPNTSTHESKNVSVNVKEELAIPGDILCEIECKDIDSEKVAQDDVEDLCLELTEEETDKKPSRRKGRPRKHQESASTSNGETNSKTSERKTRTEKKTKVKGNSKNDLNRKGKIKIRIKSSQTQSAKPDTVTEDTNIVKLEAEIPDNDIDSDTDHYLSDFDEMHPEDTEEENKVAEVVPESKLKLSIKKSKLKSSHSSLYKPKKLASKNRASRQEARLRDRSRPFIKCSEEDCDFQTKSDKFMNRHVELVHNMNVKLSCRHCEYTTSLMRDLCLHSKQHYEHGPPYCCDEPGCGFQGQRMGLLIRHFMKHKNEKPYTCDICSKAFRTENQLSCHKKLHEGRQFVCDVCDKRFTTKGGMQTHRAIHFDNKPYLCDWCGFSTKHQSHLISHRKLHTGDLLKCTVENCSFVTNKKGYMTQHMNAHLNIRNHVCQVCGKAFVVRSKLIRHEKIHLEQKLFKCKSCDYQTSRTDRMKLHIQSHGGHLRRKSGAKFPKMLDDEDFDFHQCYEKIEPSSNSFYSKSLSESPEKTDKDSRNLLDNINVSVHHIYDKMDPSGTGFFSKSLAESVGKTDKNARDIMDTLNTSVSTIGSEVVVTAMNPEPLQLPFSQSTYRQLDLLSVAAAGLEQFAQKIHGSGYQSAFDQHQGTSYEPM